MNTELAQIEAPSVLEQVASYEEEAKSLLKSSSALRVENVKDREDAMSKLKEVKTFSKSVSDLYDKYAKPVRDALKDWKAKCDQPITLCEQAEKTIKAQVLAFDKEIQRRLEEDRKRQQEEENKAAEKRRQELADKAAEEALFGSEQAAKELEQKAEDVRPATIGTVQLKQKGLRKVTKWRVVDKSKIPLDYMQPNETLIGSIVRSGGLDVSIAGIEVYQEEIIAGV